MAGIEGSVTAEAGVRPMARPRRAVPSRLLARLRRARSASAATGSAGAFVVAAALLSFVPDAPAERGVAQQGLTWTLRGTLPADPIVGADRAPCPAGLPGTAKPV